MKDNFKNAIRFVLFWEEYWSNDSQDEGGLTIWGICKRYHPIDVENMRRMTREGAKDYASKIYKKQYWDVVGGDELVPSPLDIVLFDISVNQGVALALEIGAMAYDWRDAIILRSDSYDDKKLYGTYGKGWNKRIVSLRDYIITNYQVLEWDRKELLRAEK